MWPVIGGSSRNYQIFHHIRSHLMEANASSISSVISSGFSGLMAPQDLQMTNTPDHLLTSSILEPHPHFMIKSPKDLNTTQYANMPP